MKNLSTSLLLLLLIAATAFSAQAQTIRRCNNSGLTIAGVNIYTTLQAAHDAASANDIIYLEPTSNSYGPLICVRPLTIIGNGYFLNENPGLQLALQTSETGTVTFANGSAGSRITGCVIAGMNIGASNITVERNQITSTFYIGYNPAIGSVGVSNVLVRQNYITGGGNPLFFFPGSTAATAINNVIVNGNIITTGISTATGNYTRLGSILISNNVLGNLAGTSGGLDVDNAVIKNNILTPTSGTGNNFTPRSNAFSNNISGNAAFGTANGNQQNIAPSAIFVGGTASTDGAFQLRTGSPAIGTGESGVDVGAFGGTIPYRIAGIPNVPSIYQFNQSVSGNSLNGTISTRSNN
ncbi:hypothetical protein GCM10022408_37660 [Hymenobacter fastidiosus]|uniref:Right-handed parallel beta-helix repeat-containing protein n=1 Tax=Hymenobacter fastidiosus TaxID=486264 RepID=A0ABP7T2G8_9BACT